VDEIDVLSVLLLHRARQVGILRDDPPSPVPRPDPHPPSPTPDRDPRTDPRCRRYTFPEEPQRSRRKVEPEQGDDPDGFKFCVRCKRDVPKWRFGRNKVNKDRLSTYCRPCNNAYHRAWEQRKREAQLEDKYEKQINSSFDFAP
jgi:hypothetical protein